MDPKILIAVPAYGDNIKAQCVTGIVRTVKALSAKGIQTEFWTVSSPSVVGSRNVIGSRIVSETAFSHLLFIDNDMEFAETVILRMLDAGKALIGCICPRKTIHPQTVESFNIRTRNRPWNMQDSMFRVDGIGTGIMLVDRTVFVTLASTAPQKPLLQATWKVSYPVYGFFDCPNDLGEDFAFCERWTKQGGEIWALVDPTIGHIGDFTYRGDFKKAAARLLPS
jgi:hypothetical protein